MIYYHSGCLNQRFSVEQPTNQDDGCGGQAVIWQPFQIIWGHVIKHAVSHEFIAGRRVAANTLSIVIRALPELETNMRVHYKGIYYTIDGITEIVKQPEFYECVLKQGDVT